MKINSISQNSFQKNLVAKGGYLKNCNPHFCNIYQITPEKDREYFLNPKNNSDWRSSLYWRVISTSFPNGMGGDVYVVEDEDDDKCFGFMAIRKNNKTHELDINLIETNPKFQGDSIKEVKYLGETMLSYLAQYVQNQNLKGVIVKFWDKNAQNFYTQKCGFEGDKILVLNKDNCSKLVSQNEKHTGIKIDLDV
ncbi:GNAT family N-acetyltransferase [bacterium]|nr:GNAT family N-acetyltransferase [bacterium]